MKTSNFQNLVQSITGRDFIIQSNTDWIENGKEYIIYRILPHTQRKISFKWKAALTDEKMLRSFITAFCSKYREPNPLAYGDHNFYGDKYHWKNKTEQEREYAYFHHASNMYSKAALLKQIEENLNNASIQEALIKYGFYPTEYGVGIFCFWETPYVTNAINKMKAFLTAQNIPYSNEFSDARWVFRFKLNISKEAHTQLLGNFN
jgi:hypothetical protein